MTKPRCLCNGRTDIRCDENGCDLAAPPQSRSHSGCVICWQYHYSEPHRNLWGGEGAAKCPPETKAEAPPLRVHAAPASPAPITTRRVSNVESRRSAPVLRLGDRVEAALTATGVTQERVQRWLGNCNCADRKQKLNALSDWAETALRESAEKAKGWLLKIIGG